MALTNKQLVTIEKKPKDIGKGGAQWDFLINFVKLQLSKNKFHNKLKNNFHIKKSYHCSLLRFRKPKLNNFLD
jgi:hypothetical protein